MGIETAVMAIGGAVQGYQNKKHGNNAARAAHRAELAQIKAKRQGSVAQIAQGLGDALMSDTNLGWGLGRAVGGATAEGSGMMGALDIARVMQGSFNLTQQANNTLQGRYNANSANFTNSMLSAGGQIIGAWGAGPTGTSGLNYGPTSDYFDWT